MLFFKLGIRDEDGQFSQIPSKRNMDYHKKMVAAPPQKCKHEDDDDDVEALRFAALQSLRTAAKDPSQNRRPLPHQGRSQSYQGSQSSRPYYNKARGDHFSHRQQRQNGTRNNYAQKNYRNPNLIEIVPVVEVPATSASKENIDTQKSQSSSDGSKFQRYDDNASGSEDEDVKDIDAKVEIKAEEKESTENEEVLTDKENESGVEESPKERTAEEEEEDRLLNDDDDDVLLMADLEEEVSLDRLMDEMEREIKDDKISIKKEKSEFKKVREQKKSKPEVKPKEEPIVKDKPDVPVASKPPPTAIKPEPRPVSPRPNFRRRSMSPKPRPWRKASPRRSPRRSPMRTLKKLRYRSPPSRHSPRSPRLSPRPRSPRMSPRRSPNRSPMRRSPLPLRKLSPRGRSPRLSPRPRSPRIRSRSPRSRSRSPRRSPRRLRSRSPRYSPHRYSPRIRSRSPRSRSPRSPRRRLSRSRSPRSPRRGSPRLRSPRMSPRRLSPRYRSPRGSPRRSPWSSPRRSPRMSPKRAWSPIDGLRKPRPKSITPERRSNSPQTKDFPLAKSKSPDTDKLKPKRDIVNEKSQAEPPKEPEPNPDPVLEARRRKFESQTPIDPINANKKIKLSNKKEEPKKPEIKKLEIKKAEVKKVEVKKLEPVEEMEEPESKGRKVSIAIAQYSEQEDDLCLDTTYEFGELGEEMEEEEQEVEVNSTEVSLEVEPVSHEKKRKKKKDKEIYQVGKLKGDVPLAERVVKEKKFKKRKVETVMEGSSEVETIFEDTVVADEEGDLRAELSRRRAERLNRTVPMQSARLLQSAFKGVVNEVAKNNAKVNQRHVIKGDEKPAQKEVRRVTVLHRTLTDFHDSEEETALETKVPVRLRLGLNKAIQETRETKVSRKSSKRQGRKTIATLLEQRSLLKEELKSLDDELKDQKSDEIKEYQETNGAENNSVLIIKDFSEEDFVNSFFPALKSPETSKRQKKDQVNHH